MTITSRVRWVRTDSRHSGNHRAAFRAGITTETSSASGSKAPVPSESCVRGSTCGTWFDPAPAGPRHGQKQPPRGEPGAAPETSTGWKSCPLRTDNYRMHGDRSSGYRRSQPAWRQRISGSFGTFRVNCPVVRLNAMFHRRNCPGARQELLPRSAVTASEWSTGVPAGPAVLPLGAPTARRATVGQGGADASLTRAQAGGPGSSPRSW